MCWYHIICLLKKDHTTTYSLAKGIDHKHGKYFTSAANLHEIQRTEKHGELHHKPKINKTETVSSADLVPQILKINYKENEGMEEHCKLKVT